MKSKKAYYYEVFRKVDSQGRHHYTPVITTDEQEAKQHDDYRIANLDDLYDQFCANGETLKGVVEAQEGLFLWEEFENAECGYRQLKNLKAVHKAYGD